MSIYLSNWNFRNVRICLKSTGYRDVNEGYHTHDILPPLHELVPPKSKRKSLDTPLFFNVDHYPRNSWRSAEIKIHPVRIELPQRKSSQRLTWWTNTSSGCSRGVPSLLLMERKPKPIRMLNHLQTPLPRDRPEASSWLRAQPPAQETEMMTVSGPGQRTAAQRGPVLK